MRVPSVPSPLRKQAPRRRPATRRGRVGRARLRVRTVLILAGVGLATVILGWAALARAFAPHGNTTAGRFDTLIVLGTPPDADGNPRPAMLSRVDEGVKEYERGVAPRMILTGGLDGHRYREAEVMARVARSRGVPSSAIVIEPNANDTIQNACFSARIMREHGWRSAEVIANPIQLSRAGLIFSRLPIDWRAHVAPPMEPLSGPSLVYWNLLEVLKTARYLVYANRTEACSL
ncbi:YdcF family protein [Acidobacteria bacterium AB60]|nr:YdcF family protein [Acidobacteria bacterium AB60]